MLKRLVVVLWAAGLAVACGQSDAGITTAVKAKLAADTTVRAYEIDVDTNNRIVTLEGEVETSIAKDQALTLARETDGVRDVVDKLRVAESAATAGVLDDDDTAGARDTADRAGDAADRAGEAVTDAGITTAVKAKLLADEAVSGLAIDVDTSGGVVTLSGEANTRAEADQAVKLARGTEGVSRVVDKLRVAR
jgi:hyperosmotically inducible periplasmic protein